ncbi:MAG: hypothetical protein HKO65_00245, partial [Gemmatimonadetes bacterium]|nr:hypothetical protein [Gemmatimonadota bacterium]
MIQVRPASGFLLLAILLGSASSPTGAPPLVAQDTELAEAAPSSPDPRPLTLEDYGLWSTIGQVALSADGRWMTFAYAPNEGDSKLYLRDLDDLGSDPVELSENGTGPSFSDDSKWLAYTVSTGEGEDQKRTLHLLGLQTEDRWEVDGPSSFSFSDDSEWFAVHKSRPTGDDGARGADLILRSLQNGSITNLGNVAEVAFNKGSTHLAYLVDAEGKAGNGLFLYELGGGRILPLNTGDFLYQGLSWHEEGRALAVLRGSEPTDLVQRENQLVTFRDLESSGETYDPSNDSAFPAGFVISEFRAPSWSEDGERVFVGIKEQQEKLEEAEEPRADVVVWHWKDKRVQSQQEVQAGRDRRATHLSVLNLEDSRFFQLSSDQMEQVQLTQDGRWAVGFDDSRYWTDPDHERNRDDVYRIDPVTGEKTLIAEALMNSMGTSPDSRWFLYWQNQSVRAYALDSGRTLNLTESAGGIDFENKEFDRPLEKPTYGVGGWSTDGETVFLNHKYDVWQLPLGGGEAINLTGGTGARDEIRFRIMDLNPEDDGVDTSEPILLSAYGEWTKQSGYFEAVPGRAPRELIFEDAMLGTAGFRGSGIRKAKDGDRFLFTRQTFADYPDY